MYRIELCRFETGFVIYGSDRGCGHGEVVSDLIYLDLPLFLLNKVIDGFDVRIEDEKGWNTVVKYEIDSDEIRTLSVQVTVGVLYAEKLNVE